MFGKRSDGNGKSYWTTLAEGDIAGIEKMLSSKGSGWDDLLKEVRGTELNMRLILKEALSQKEPSVELAPVLNGVFLNWMNLELVSLISRLGMETAELTKKMDDCVKEMRQLAKETKKA